jgi:hypothetical protein
MFNKILDQLNSIGPVLSILDDNGTLSVEFDNYNLSSEESVLVNNILESWPLEKERYIKLQDLDSNWKNVLKNGWTTSYGYKLGIDIQDITLLNGAFTLAKEASLMGMNDPISIVDLDGASHSLSLQDLTILMLQYGQARASLSNSYAAIKQSINAATTIQELDAIDTNI